MPVLNVSWLRAEVIYSLLFNYTQYTAGFREQLGRTPPNAGPECILCKCFIDYSLTEQCNHILFIFL